MKWILWVLAIALVLIGLDYVIGDQSAKRPLSDDPLAVSFYEDGLEDLFAFRTRTAIQKLERSLEMDPALAEAGIALAQAHMRLGQVDEYKAALALADSLTEKIDDDGRRMLAQLRICRSPATTSHTYGDSLMSRLASEYPENIFVLEAQASVADSDRDMDEAERIWKRILEIDPNYAASYNMLGYLELRRGNYDVAIEHMQKYAFLSPGTANPHDSLGDVLRVLGRYDEAEKSYRQALSIQRDFFHSLINIGRIYISRGQLEVGLDILQKVRDEATGENIKIQLDQEMIAAYLVWDLPEELAHSTAEYAVNYPETEAAAYYRSMRSAYRGDYATSRSIADSLLTEMRTCKDYKSSAHARLSTETASLRYEAHVANLRASADKRVKIWSKLIQFIEDRVAFYEQWYELGQLAEALKDAGRPAEALEVLEPVLKVNPHQVHPLTTAVECSVALRRAPEARKFLDQLRWNLARADENLPAKMKLADLEARVVELEGAS